LVPSNATTRVVVPSDDSLGTDWTQPEFDDSSWTSGTASVGYDTVEYDPAEDLIPVAVELSQPEGFWRFSLGSTRPGRPS